MAHAFFCIRYPQDCAATAETPFHRHIERQGLLTELSTINERINREIRPFIQNSSLSPTIDDKWLIKPLFGDCNDFAVSKRHELMASGWSSASLLLAEVALSSGERHLVLVAYADKHPYVLDNLNKDIVPLAEVTGYEWLRLESSSNPRVWTRVVYVKGYSDARSRPITN